MGLFAACLWVTAVSAGGHGNTWYVAEEPGHFDYYWPGRSDGGWRGDVPGVGYSVDGQGFGPIQGRDEAPARRAWEDVPRWDGMDSGARRANLVPGDLYLQDDQWSSDYSRRADHPRAPAGVAPGYGLGTDTIPGHRAPSTWGAEPAYRFRRREGPGASYSADVPRFEGRDYSESRQSAYPRYRFRGDPLPGEAGWRVDPGASAYRFRPLSDQELERIQTSSGYRPLSGTEGASFYRPQSAGDEWRRGGTAPGRPSSPWADR